MLGERMQAQVKDTDRYDRDHKKDSGSNQKSIRFTRSRNEGWQMSRCSVVDAFNHVSDLELAGHQLRLP